MSIIMDVFGLWRSYSAVTVSPSGPRKLFKGVTTATSGVLARFPWLLPVRNSFASDGASAVARRNEVMLCLWSKRNSLAHRICRDTSCTLTKGISADVPKIQRCYNNSNFTVLVIIQLPIYLPCDVSCMTKDR